MLLKQGTFILSVGRYFQEMRMSRVSTCPYWPFADLGIFVFLTLISTSDLHSHHCKDCFIWYVLSLGAAQTPKPTECRT